MASMVAAYSVGKQTDPEKKARVEKAAAQLNRADQLLRALITQDAIAYSAMTEAAKTSKGDGAQGYQDAVISALSVPVEMAALVSSMLATLDEFKQDASKYLLSDLGVAAVLADATARAARYTVLVNVAELADPQLRQKLKDEIDTVLGHCDTHRASIETFVTAHLEAVASTGR
jgi:formiminotetrahydrofolate cyclodeaminase